MKLLGSTKSKIAKDENGDNVPYLEITEVILVHSNTVNNNYQQNPRLHLVLIHFLVNYQIFHTRNIFLIMNLIKQLTIVAKLFILDFCGDSDQASPSRHLPTQS